MSDQVDALHDRVQRLESRCTALGLACIVLAGLATMGMLTPAVEPPAVVTLPGTITVENLTAEFITTRQIVVKDAEGRNRGSLVVEAEGMMMGMFEESGELVWKAP